MVIPDSVERIGVMAFYWCTHLDTLVIGSGIKSIGDWAFNSPSIPGGGGEFFNAIESITCLATTPSSMVADAFETSYSTSRLIVPQGSLLEYKNANGWKKFVYIKTTCQQDMNDDGEVNIADINCLIEAIISGDDFDFMYDTNHDNEVNIADVNAIIDFILRKK